MGKTEGTTRIYTCKRCGGEMKEPIESWRKKAQNQKNICPFCIGKAALAKQAARERAEDAGFGHYGYYRLYR